MSGTLLWDRLRVTVLSSSRSPRGGGKLSGSWSVESDLCDLRSLFMLGARAEVLPVGHVQLQSGSDSLQHSHCLMAVAPGQEWPRSSFSFPLTVRV